MQLAHRAHQALPGAPQLRTKAPNASAAPRPLPRLAGRRPLRPMCSGGGGGAPQQPAGEGPSTSGAHEQQQQWGKQQQQQGQRQQQQQGAWGPRAAKGLGAAGLAGSAAIATPGLGGGSGGGATGGNGGGGGGWGPWGWGSGGGGGGGGSPLFDIAAAAAAGDAAASGAGKKKKKGQQAAEDDPEAAKEEALLEEADAPTEDASGAAAASRRRPEDELITSDTEIAEMAAADGGGGDGQRHGTRRCVEVVIEGWPEVGALPKQSELKDMLSVQEGFIFDYQDVVDDRRKLELQYDEYIANVDIRTEYVDDKSNHQRVVYKFRPYVFEGIDTIEIKNATLMPQRVVDDIIKTCLPPHAYRVEIGLMDKVREKIEKWYQDRGLPFCYVGYFDGMEEGTLRANVIEAKINDVAVRYERPAAGDVSDGVEVYSQGDVVPAERVIAAAGFKKGEHYHIDDGQDAINNIYACGLIEEINIEPEQDMQDPSKINIKVVVEEVQPKSMEMDLDWAFALKDGVPQITRQSLIPGGSVEVSHENLFGDSQSLSVSLSASDWRNPAADLGFQMSYTEPFYKPNTTRNLQVFNTRKMSPVFTPGAEPDVPPVFVDRFGAKAWTSHVGGEDNKVEHALMLQQIQTVDENGQPVSKGTKVARGYYADNGPPTTLSGTGRDVSLSYQGFAALDNVQFVNGNQLGRRLLLQVDQGLNLKVPLPGGRSLGFGGGLYNRMVVTATKFLQIPGLPRLTDDDVWIRRRAPNTLVLHARAGNCIGDMASYDYFALGGPYSVRGYAPGELGAARRFAELAAEVRLPLKNVSSRLPGTAYAFAECGTDLGSGHSLAGAPTEYYRKAGRGASYGVGLKALGACRFEYARDCNAGAGNFFVSWGERF